MRNIPTFEQFINESDNTSKIITVTTNSGKETFTDDDIQEMIDDIQGSYWVADNLPKWMYLANLIKSQKNAPVVLKKILDHKGDVDINVAVHAPFKSRRNVHTIDYK